MNSHTRESTAVRCFSRARAISSNPIVRRLLLFRLALAQLLAGCSLLLITFTIHAEDTNPIRTNSADAAIMILIPAGPFVMGTLDGEPDEAPPRRETLPAFYIDKFEVTNEQYAKFLKATARKPPIDWPNGTVPPKFSKHPVVNVTFADAEAYA